MLTLEVLECDSPKDRGPWPWRKAERVVPAEWWIHAAQNAAWVELGRMRWWSYVRLALYSWKHYWPIRLKTRGGLIVWQSEAAGNYKKDSPNDDT